MFFRPVNLPLPIFIANGTLLATGLHVAIFTRLPWPFHRINITTKGKDKDKDNKERKPLELFAPSPTTPRITDTTTLFGLVTSCLMAPYFLSSYMPIEENQFLAVSVPIRLAASACLFGHALFRGAGGKMSVEGYWEFLGFAVLDLAASVHVGYTLGRFDGVVPGFL
ncbi:uncharacterized protein BJX67DRAFT_342769 [Aspergillus lucknowensis]|uniref:Uncharacterized protein n=1 Tax=Aspergillus lucknowensis TaxID=176173 RepID=A0ABR4M4X8_9EURO